MDGSQIKVLGGCYTNGKLRKIRIATNDPELIKKWEELRGQPIFNGWRRKIWKKRIVVGCIRYDELWISPDRSVIPKFPCLRVCLSAGVLVEELFGIKMEELRPGNNSRPCPLYTGKRNKREELVF